MPAAPPGEGIVSQGRANSEARGPARAQQPIDFPCRPRLHRQANTPRSRVGVRRRSSRARITTRRITLVERRGRWSHTSGSPSSALHLSPGNDDSRSARLMQAPVARSCFVCSSARLLASSACEPPPRCVGRLFRGSNPACVVPITAPRSSSCHGRLAVKHDEGGSDRTMVSGPRTIRGGMSRSACWLVAWSDGSVQARWRVTGPATGLTGGRAVATVATERADVGRV